MRAASPCAVAAIRAFQTLSLNAAEQDIALVAHVAPSCTLNGENAPIAMITHIPVTGGQVATAPINLQVPVSCNTAAAISVSTFYGGLLGPNPLVGERPRIDYLATVSVPHTLQNSGNNTYKAAAPSQPLNGNIDVSIIPYQPSTPVAGRNLQRRHQDFRRSEPVTALPPLQCGGFHFWDIPYVSRPCRPLWGVCGHARARPFGPQPSLQKRKGLLGPSEPEGVKESPVPFSNTATTKDTSMYLARPATVVIDLISRLESAAWHILEWHQRTFEEPVNPSALPDILTDPSP